LPAYPAISAGISNTQVVAEFDNFAGHVVLRYGEYNGVGVYLIDAPHLYAREGNPYHDCYYNDYGDNYKRFKSEFERYLSEEEKNEISDKIYERQEAEIEGGLWQDFDLDR